MRLTHITLITSQQRSTHTRMQVLAASISSRYDQQNLCNLLLLSLKPIFYGVDMVGSDPSGTSHWTSWEIKYVGIHTYALHDHINPAVSQPYNTHRFSSSKHRYLCPKIHLSHLSHGLCFLTPSACNSICWV
jgi:hypothetical protein